MWGDFVDEFRARPSPTAWKKDAELRDTLLRRASTQRAEPDKVSNAKPALKKCLDYSVKYQYFDEFSRNCEVWLAKNYKAEYHVVDELRGAPTLSNSGLDDAKPLPLGRRRSTRTFRHPPAAGAREDQAVTATAERQAPRSPSKGGGGKAAEGPKRRQTRAQLPGGKKK